MSVNPDSITCRFCEAYFEGPDRRAEHAAHMRTEHAIPADAPRLETVLPPSIVPTCTQCGKTFKNEAGLAGHARSHQTALALAARPSADRAFACTCGQTFETSRRRAGHIGGTKKHGSPGRHAPAEAPYPSRPVSKPKAGAAAPATRAGSSSAVSPPPATGVIEPAAPARDHSRVVNLEGGGKIAVRLDALLWDLTQADLVLINDLRDLIERYEAAR